MFSPPTSMWMVPGPRSIGPSTMIQCVCLWTPSIGSSTMIQCVCLWTPIGSSTMIQCVCLWTPSIGSSTMIQCVCLWTPSIGSSTIIQCVCLWTPSIGSSTMIQCVCLCVQRALRSAGGSEVHIQGWPRPTGGVRCRAASSVPVACRRTVSTPSTSATVMPTSHNGTTHTHTHTHTHTLLSLCHVRLVAMGVAMVLLWCCYGVCSHIEPSFPLPCSGQMTSGLLTNKETLPLRSLVLGDIQRPGSEASYRVGPLRCHGDSKS